MACGVSGSLFFASAGLAQQSEVPDQATQQASRSTQQISQASEATPPDDKFKRFDALDEPGLEVNFPPLSDTLLRDVGGWRSTLADADIGVIVRSSVSVDDDVLRNNLPASPQAYNGQKFTLLAASPQLVVTAGLGRFGLANAELIFSAISFHTSWAPDGPSATRIRTLAYYQSFANKAVEIKVGWHTNYTDFIGIFTGGNPVITTGLTSVIPIEVGLSAAPAATPTFNLTLNGPRGLYFKGGIQRSVSPMGQIYDARHDGAGLDFSAKGARVLYIGEFGLHRSATADTRQIWLRAGLLYNTSNYSRFVDGRYQDNWSVFALGDYQVTRPDRNMPYRGLFAGVTAEYADPQVNVYTRYYEARLYYVGISSRRPADSATISVNYSRFSPEARVAYALESIETPRSQFQASGSYAVHVLNGLYLTPNVTYSHHPAFGPYRDAVDLGLTAYFQL